MSTTTDEDKLIASIDQQGVKIRDMKANKAAPDAIKEEVAALLTLKQQYKQLTGKDFVVVGAPAPPASKKKEAPAAAATPAEGKKASAKEAKAVAPKATTAAVEEKVDLSSLTLFCGNGAEEDLLRCVLVAGALKRELKVARAAPASVAGRIPYYPALAVPSIASSSGYTCKLGTVIFGATAVCRYFALDSAALEGSLSAEQEESYLDLLDDVLSKGSSERVGAALSRLESEQRLHSSALALHALYPSLKRLATATHPYLAAQVQAVDACAALAAAQKALAEVSSAASTGAGKKANKKAASAAAGAASGAPAATAFSNEDVVKPVLGAVDWASAGLMSSLRLVFEAAIKAAFPQCAGAGSQEEELAKLAAAVITRCGNPAFGDFQCNNAMALSKALKGLAGYSGPVSPKDVAERILCALPENPIISATSCAPNGFINITLSAATLTGAIAGIIQDGVRPPVLPPQRVLVDFSSPNIAKEMHVGHLRSTIIGDCVCRLLEFCRFDVLRVNHVGDWGTQFGMLITYLQEAFPDILTNPPNISDLTLIYKASKKRFDEDAAFKELSRLNVVRLQSGDAACRAIWQLLCQISRLEFQRVYDALDVQLTEVGESFYNPLIPGTLQEMEGFQVPNTRGGDAATRSMVEDEEGMLLVKLDHFTIPLILRKSDGGYGYDSTDMAALKYRTATLKRDWLVYITDAGQAPHFHMCFDAARACGWLADTRADHIGFGVVCGDDGKRFKTRSSETVRLIDLLDAARDRMRESLRVRAEEGKSSLAGEELEAAARIIGYGAVKYFDLKQNPNTNYVFSYDRMLDTKGDTAVYLLFAYARLASILRKAKEERGIDMQPLHAQAPSLLSLAHPAERALAFELLQLGDVIKSVIEDLLPNRLCDYLKSLAVVFTDFVTKCHVLNAENGAGTVHSRLLLCEATRRVMAQCFQLLGIGTLERI